MHRKSVLRDKFESNLLIDRKIKVIRLIKRRSNRQLDNLSKYSNGLTKFTSTPEFASTR